MTQNDADKTIPMIETHPLPPFLPANGKLLMLGSFPPPKARWKMDFYYPNFQNDMWRIFGLVFFRDKDHFVDTANKRFHEAAIRDFLQEKGIAISDAAYKAARLQGNASDKHLHIVEALDFHAISEALPHCRTILTTGELAFRTLTGSDRTVKIGGKTAFTFAKRRFTLYRLPSTSRAYPLPLAEKAACYQGFFTEIGML